MRRIALALLLGSALPVSAQTPRDSAHNTTCDQRLAQRIYDEAKRSSMRKTVMRPLADTLRLCGAGLVKPVSPPPPPDTVVVTDTARTDGPATLPAIYAPTIPAPTRVVPVPAGWNLQDAMNAAQPGDQLVLTKGASYIGNFLWTRCLSGWVTVTTQGIALPEGTRATPTVAAAFAKLVTPNVAPALTAKNGGCKLWLSRVEVTGTAQSSTVNYNYGLVRLGEDETTIAALPSDIVLERSYIHGTPTTSVQHGVLMNARRLTLKDSWVSEIHWPGVESHAVAGWAGTGPFTITGNYLDAAGINVLFGGAAPTITGVSSSDVYIARNHFAKQAAYQGKNYVVKNLLELKDAKRVLAEGNVMQMTPFYDDQGMIVNAQTLTDAGTPTVQTTDLTIRYNRMSGGIECFLIGATGYNEAGTPMTRVSIHDNLCTDVGTTVLGQATNRALLLVKNLRDVSVRHNTMVRSASPVTNFGMAVEGTGATGIVFSDNIYGSGQPYGCVFRSGGTYDWQAWSAFSPSAVVRGNVCWDNAAGFATRVPGDVYPASQAAVGFAADWSLLPTSPYKAKATDGRDPGADIPELTRRTAGVVVAP